MLIFFNLQFPTFILTDKSKQIHTFRKKFRKSLF
nr:MAG TPA: hypothetical protein [Caudoviricetes sp.]